MSKLFKLRKWLTILECAKRLSVSLDQEVCESDIIRLSVDGHLKISVHLPTKIEVVRGELVALNQASYKQTSLRMLEVLNQMAAFKRPPPPPIDIPPMVLKGYKVNDDLVFEETGRGCYVSGLYDVFMSYDASINLESIFRSNTCLAPIEAPFFSHLVLEDEDQNYFLFTGSTADGALLPHDAEYVVRTAALLEFEQSINGMPDSVAEPLSAKERNNLLKQIGAFALAFSEKSGKYKRGDRPNVSQIAEEALAVVEAFPDANKSGFGKSNLRENISAGLELLLTK